MPKDIDAYNKWIAHVKEVTASAMTHIIDLASKESMNRKVKAQIKKPSAKRVSVLDLQFQAMEDRINEVYGKTAPIKLPDVTEEENQDNDNSSSTSEMDGDDVQDTKNQGPEDMDGDDVHDINENTISTTSESIKTPIIHSKESQDAPQYEHETDMREVTDSERLLTVANKAASLRNCAKGTDLTRTGKLVSSKTLGGAKPKPLSKQSINKISDNNTPSTQKDSVVASNKGTEMKKQSIMYPTNSGVFIPIPIEQLTTMSDAEGKVVLENCLFGFIRSGVPTLATQITEAILQQPFECILQLVNSDFELAARIEELMHCISPNTETTSYIRNEMPTISTPSGIYIKQPISEIAKMGEYPARQYIKDALYEFYLLVYPQHASNMAALISVNLPMLDLFELFNDQIKLQTATKHVLAIINDEGTGTSPEFIQVPNSKATDYNQNFMIKKENNVQDILLTEGQAFASDQHSGNGYDSPYDSNNEDDLLPGHAEQIPLGIVGQLDSVDLPSDDQLMAINYFCHDRYGVVHVPISFNLNHFAKFMAAKINDLLCVNYARPSSNTMQLQEHDIVSILHPTNTNGMCRIYIYYEYNKSKRQAIVPVNTPIEFILGSSILQAGITPDWHLCGVDPVDVSVVLEVYKVDLTYKLRDNYMRLVITTPLQSMNNESQ